MQITIRKASEGDLEAVTRIYSQVQALHVEWRPDIYKSNDGLPGRERFLELVNGGLIYVAEAEESGAHEPKQPACVREPGSASCAAACVPKARVAGVLELNMRHIENTAQVTRDVIFVEAMAVDEAFRGKGIGRAFFEFLKSMRDEGGYDGIELQVNAMNREAYEMYRHCGFREKSINMELADV